MVLAMTEAEMKRRTKQFALDVMVLVGELPKCTAGYSIGRQLMDSAGSVGANYRAVCRSRSRAEFVSRLAVVEEEYDESGFWLELIVDGRLLSRDRVAPLLKEADEITAMITASRKRAAGASEPRPTGEARPERPAESDQ